MRKLSIFIYLKSPSILANSRFSIVKSIVKSSLGAIGAPEPIILTE